MNVSLLSPLHQKGTPQGSSRAVVCFDLAWSTVVQAIHSLTFNNSVNQKVRQLLSVFVRQRRPTIEVKRPFESVTV